MRSDSGRTDRQTDGALRPAARRIINVGVCRPALRGVRTCKRGVRRRAYRSLVPSRSFRSLVATLPGRVGLCRGWTYAYARARLSPRITHDDGVERKTPQRRRRQSQPERGKLYLSICRRHSERGLAFLRVRRVRCCCGSPRGEAFIGPIPWGHSGPLCHALSSSSSSSSSWTSMRRRRATVAAIATPGE